MNEPEPMFADNFAEGSKVDNPHAWHSTPNACVVYSPSTCEHEWMEATITLEFESGKKQDVPGYRCAKCPWTKIVTPIG